MPNTPKHHGPAELGVEAEHVEHRRYFDEPGFNRDIRFDDAIYTAGIRARF